MINNYESQLSKLQKELEHLKKDTESRNALDGVSYGDGESEPGTSQLDSSATISSGDTLPTPPLKEPAERSIKDTKAAVTPRKKEFKVLEDKLLVRQPVFVKFCFT